MNDLIDWINALNEEESKDMIVLYSPILQNLSELASCILIRLPANPPGLTVPEHIKAMI